MFFGVLTWIALTGIVAVYAKRTGRNPTKWFFLSLIGSPALAWLLLLALGHATPDIATHQQCTSCMEWVHPQATRCRFCSAELSSSVKRSAEHQPSHNSTPACGTSTGDFLG
jgi:hypothetical protein